MLAFILRNLLMLMCDYARFRVMEESYVLTSMMLLSGSRMYMLLLRPSAPQR